MQAITVGEKYSNIKIEKYLQAMYPALPYGALQKALRKKDIKANGRRVGRDYIVSPGDKLEIYITDDLLFGKGSLSGSDLGRGFSTVYEDDNIIIVNKEQGVPVHPDRSQPEKTLIDQVRKYINERDKSSGIFSKFQPELCHRLDRNTGGLVIIAKNQESLDIMLEKLEKREVKKYYLCVVKGKMEKPQAMLKAWLWKDAAKSRVYIYDQWKTGSLEILTGYKEIEYNPEKDISLLEVELITGRTHQIRAHLAYAGHPIIGDGKYGKNKLNNLFGIKQQALWAYKIRFSFSKGNTPLDYLNNMEFVAYPDAIKKFGFH